MKKILLFLALVAGNVCLAQTAAPENLHYADKLDATAGRFGYQLNERETVNVNYSLSPKTPADKAQFTLHTPDPMAFFATITNQKGKTVYEWKPKTKDYLYRADWNLASLKPGIYTVHIFLQGQENSIYQFDFSK